MSTAIELDDYRWLVGEEGARWLAEFASVPAELVAQASRLRRDLSAARAHLVLEQIELRRRARAKFPQADRMFFTPTALEQATDQATARYKAGRYRSGVSMADLCCGIGGDLRELASRGPAMGIERDPVIALLAEANGRTLDLDIAAPRIEIADVAEFDVSRVAAWHLDPDRRARGGRAAQIANYEPGLAVIERLLETNPHAGIKLAPAALVPDEWNTRAELEWLSRHGECKQLVAWFGDLASDVGRRRATIVADDGRSLRCVTGSPEGIAFTAPQGVGAYLYEPDAAVLAARLTGALANELQLAPIAPGAVYLTGEQPIVDPAVGTFRVLEVMPFRVKAVREALRLRGLGRIEVKKRGVEHDPENLRRELSGPAAGPGTVIVTRLGPRVIAIIAQRMTTVTDEAT